MPKSSPEEPTLPLPERLRRYYAETNGLKIALSNYRAGNEQELAGFRVVTDEAKASIEALVKRYSSPHLEGFARGILPQVTALHQALPTVSASREEMLKEVEDLLNKANGLLYDLQIQHAEEKRGRQVLEYANGKMLERFGNLTQAMDHARIQANQIVIEARAATTLDGLKKVADMADTLITLVESWNPLIDRIKESAPERDLEEELEPETGA